MRKETQAHLFVGVFLIALSAHAQLRLTDFKFAVPFETNVSGVTRPKSVLSAGQAQPLSNNFYQAQSVRIENYQLDGRTNLIVRAAESLFDAANTLAFSTNRIALESPNGLFIEGTGFICYLTNFNLIISNDVRTLVQQRLLRAAPEVTGRLPTNQVPGTNIAMTIRADRFELNYASNMITYFGHIRADHSLVTLESERLTVLRNTNGTLERIVAEESVRILNKSDHSQAMGDLAIYTFAPTESIALSGHARWNDDQRQSRADRFLFDPKQKHLRAEGHAWMSLPRQSVAQPKLGLTKTTNAPPGGTVEITADLLDLQMPTTNQPSRNLIAETNVLIVSAADQTRATANKAVFEEGTGLAELTGNAVWQTGDRVARGGLLRYLRTNGMFFAQSNAYLKMPVSAIAASPTSRPSAAKTTMTNAPVPQFVEVYSSQYTYTSNSLTFLKDVRGQLLEADKPRGSIECLILVLRFTNQLETASAHGGVKIVQFPWREASGKTIAKLLRCEDLDIKMQPGGTVERLVAEKDIFAEQREWHSTNAKPIRSVFTADHVTADFFARTNQVREGVANGHVSIYQQGRVANADRALYHGTNDIVEFVGHPTAEFPEGKITDAEILFWDRARNKFFGRGIKGQGEIHASRTNQTTLPK